MALTERKVLTVMADMPKDGRSWLVHIDDVFAEIHSVIAVEGYGVARKYSGNGWEAEVKSVLEKA